MDYFIFFKTIADMFYSVAFLDYIMMAVASVLFVVSLTRLPPKYLIDFCAIFFMVLLTFTIIRNTEGVTNYIKTISAFFLYFIGRYYYRDYHKAEKALVKSYYIVVLVNFIMMILGLGYIIWGSALTFRGMYYYKTDLGISMIYAISAFAFFDVTNKKIIVAEWIIIGIIILRSNTRAAMIIYLLVLGLWFLFLREKKSTKILKINLKYVIGVIILVIVALYIVSWLLSLSVFKNLHFINFNFTKFSDLYSDDNMQGRNNVWQSIIENFNNASLWQRIFGIDFVSDRYISWDGSVYDSHNAYLKILFTTGYLGLLTYILFILLCVLRLNNLKDRSLFYFNLSILITFLCQSISQSSIEFTQMTWIFMFFIGCGVSMSYYDESNDYYFNESSVIRLRIDNKIINL